jgi:glyoxylase-like metal-dependent hydrolase (beta-lactamase superfamily II)
VNVIEINERLFYWSEPHPDWKPNPEWPEDVGCVLYESPDALVLIDPLVRDDLDPAAWSWLDDAAADAKRPVVVLLTAPWHERSARRAADRYHAPVWVAPSARGRFRDLAQLQTIPKGVLAFEPRGVVNEGQVAFFIEAERTLVVAEFFLGTAGGLAVLPPPVTHDLREFAEWLHELERLPIERVLVAHGPPVLNDGSRAVAVALRDFGAG